jgi:hypothetical protein
MERGIMSTQRQTGRRSRLSVIVPATSVADLEETLVSVLEHRPEECDVVVALAEPYDDPWNIREEVTFVDLPQGSGLVDCIAAGVAASSGDVIHVLASGWKAIDGWTVPAMRHFANGRVAAVVPLAVSEADHTQPVSAGIRRTAGGRSVTVVPSRKTSGIVTGRLPAAPMIEAGFWRADVLRDIGFSKACGDALAAADMAAALSAVRADVVLEPDSRVVSGPLPMPSSSFRAGMHAERLFWRSLPCERTGTALIAHLGEVMRHAALTAPLGTLGMLAGRVAALVQFGSCLARTRQLKELMRGPADRDFDTDMDARTYRIDEPHESAGRPHVAAPASPLRRSA